MLPHTNPPQDGRRLNVSAVVSHPHSRTFLTRRTDNGPPTRRPRRFAASDQRLSAFPDGAAPHDVAQVWGNIVSID